MKLINLLNKYDSSTYINVFDYIFRTSIACGTKNSLQDNKELMDHEVQSYYIDEDNELNVFTINKKLSEDLKSI